MKIKNEPQKINFSDWGIGSWIIEKERDVKYFRDASTLTPKEKCVRISEILNGYEFNTRIEDLMDRMGLTQMGNDSALQIGSTFISEDYINASKSFDKMMDFKKLWSGLINEYEKEFENV
jgi:hypothetical protein